ncbi:hypothetical protein [Mycobacterium sp. URHD0025]|uniref:hypothetical protein n=1 Tax=Mycobacterium sp. URHD0025 TaxID=1298864 RepID=UPI00048F6B58|nr:hypothetical protein [Mycobacterium sp. URHD0025]
MNRPELSWSDNRYQLLLALMFGAVGLISLILLIGQIAHVLTPVKLSLENIPEDMIRDLNAAADVRLPSGSRTYSEFLGNYRKYRTIAATTSDALARIDSKSHHADLRRDQLKTLSEQAQRNAQIYNRAADSYLNQAEFYSVSGLFKQSRILSLVLAIGAAVGALTFQLALASRPTDTPKPPALSYILAPQGPNALWDSLGLQHCTLGARVPVLVSAGDGSDDQPYAVTVLKVNDQCTPTSFQLRGDALTLVRIPPTTVTVEYRP